MRLSGSVCEATMNRRRCGENVSEREWAEDDGEQHHQGDLLHRPTKERKPAVPGPLAATPERPKGQPGKITGQAERTDRGTVMRLQPDELVRLAPRLRPYLGSAAPNWREIVDAADWLRHDLGVSKSLWGEACLALGREEAAVALAIVSAKPVGHFRTSPGGYFHGMVAKAKAGELHLSRTVWALRAAATPPDRARRREAESGPHRQWH